MKRRLEKGKGKMGHRLFVKIRFAAAEAMCSAMAIYDKVADRPKKQRSLQNNSGLQPEQGLSSNVIGGIHRNPSHLEPQITERLSA
jgi:hypothetical protein